MNSHNHNSSQGGGLKLADVAFVLFRRKWIVLGCFALGLAAAAGVYCVVPRMYSSQAKLYVRYVFDSKVPNGAGGEAQIRQPDAGGENIINSEVEILKSLDLVTEVVEAVSAEKILMRAGGGKDPVFAAEMIAKNLQVQVQPRTDVLGITFQHPDQTIVQPVLKQLIISYLKKHDVIHRGVGAVDELLTQQTDSLRSQLAQVEQELRAAKMTAGIVSLEDTKRAYTDQISRIRQEILDCEAETAEQQAGLKEMLKSLPPQPDSEEPVKTPNAPVPSEKAAEYRSILARMETLRRREQELLGQFTEENMLLKGVREQLGKAEALRKSLETEYPALVVAGVEPATGRTLAPVVDVAAEQMRLAALDAKLKTLNSQLEKVLAEVARINEAEPAIARLQMKKELLETQYRYYSSSLDQARFNDALGAGRLSNIGIAQAPSPAAKESRKLMKILGGIVAAGLGIGIGISFLLELVLDRTVKRPSEVESKLRVPLLLTLPDLRRRGRNQPPALEPPELSGDGNPTAPFGLPVALAPLAVNRDLWTHYEGLRERLITYFEVRNIHKKPKLVAVTGCNKGAGASTIAVGLASTLSETGEGNVLLVDMTVGQGEAYPFRKGKLTCDLAGALEEESRENAKVQENLYVVAEGGDGDRLPSVLPKKFSHLVPQLKASNYDYIIFDMPPVSPISITPRLAGFMDMVLLVIESERTNRDTVKSATGLLAESKANVTAVFNKARRRVPQWLEHDR